MKPNPQATEALHSPRSFVTTHWTLVVEAMEDGTDKGQAALEELCRSYWPPLYAFARGQGVSPADAEDLTQGFFADLLSRKALSFADSARGRFRTFLLTSFRHYHSKQRRFARAEKRGGGKAIVSLEAMRNFEAQFRDEPRTRETPETLYDRKWAARLLSESLSVVRREYEALGKGGLFEELKEVLWSGLRAKSHAEIARLFDTTEGAVKVAAHRLRRRVGERFREEVAKTVASPDDVEDEIRHLLAVVSE